MNNSNTKNLIVADGSPTPNTMSERVILLNDAGKKIFRSKELVTRGTPRASTPARGAVRRTTST